jgi:hypothetical protein
MGVKNQFGYRGRLEAKWSLRNAGRRKESPGLTSHVVIKADTDGGAQCLHLQG